MDSKIDTSAVQCCIGRSSAVWPRRSAQELHGFEDRRKNIMDSMISTSTVLHGHLRLKGLDNKVCNHCVMETDRLALQIATTDARSIVQTSTSVLLDGPVLCGLADRHKNCMDSKIATSTVHTSTNLVVDGVCHHSHMLFSRQPCVRMTSMVLPLF